MDSARQDGVISMLRYRSIRQAVSLHVPLLLTRTAVLLWILVQASTAFYGAAAAAYLLARLAVGERWHWVAFANNFVPWWALGGLICGGIAAFSRHRKILIAFQAPILLAFVILYGGTVWPRGSHAQAHNGIDFVAATYNLRSVASEPQQTVRVIMSLNADLVGVEELGQERALLFQQALKNQYPYQVAYATTKASGLGLLSRYPVVAQDFKADVRGYIQYLRAVVDVRGVKLTVYVFHPHTPLNFKSPLTYNDSRRRQEIAVLEDRLAADQGPVLVLCDCNMTDQSDSYRALSRTLTDSFREAGWGLGLTFPAGTPSRFFDLPRLVRIDYIWHNAYLVASEAHVGGDSGTSDHSPVTARLTLKTNEPGE